MEGGQWEVPDALASHAEDPRVSVQVEYVLNELPVRHKAALQLTSRSCEHGLQRMVDDTANDLIVRVLERERPGVLGGPRDFDVVEGIVAFRGEDREGVVEVNGHAGA